MSRVLLVDDDAPFLEGLVLSFEQAGYDVVAAVDGAQALTMLAAEKFDCVVADVNMPRVDGFSMCRRMRERGDETPLILLTTRDGEIDEALGLELGADDYISKPVSMRVLAARVEAIMRRTRPRSSAQDPEVMVRGALVLDPARLRVTYAGVNVSVTVTEFKLIEALSSRPGLVWSRDRLLEVIREDDTTVAPRIIDTYVGRLRRKLGEIDPGSREIETVVGAGYRWRDAE